MHHSNDKNHSVATRLLIPTATNRSKPSARNQVTIAIHEMTMDQPSLTDL